MILGALILGAGLLAGASLLATFWNDITKWLKRAIEKVKQVVKGIVLGTKIFMMKIGEAFKEISKHYSKKGVKWQETIVTKEISESDVPDEIKEKVKYYETDISEEYELALQNAG